MKFLILLLVFILVLNPVSCAANQQTVKEDKATVTEQKEDGDNFWGILQFFGAVCLVGLISPSPAKEDEYKVYYIRDNPYVEKPLYRIEKENK